MVKIFNGKREAEKILLSLKKKIRKLKITPGLAVILVDGNEPSKLFIKNKKKAAKGIGIKVSLFKFKKKSKEKDIIQKIKDLNKEPAIQGIVVQLPLPREFNPKKIIETITSQKDVDGFSRGKFYFDPPLPAAILLAFKAATKNYRKEILALVNSDIFGQTLKNFLKNKGIKTNYLLRKKISLSKLKLKLKSADVVITVCGYPSFIKGDMIKKGAILIDGGVALQNKKVIGDIDKKSVENKAYFLTPVPGGLGPLNVALLLKNVYNACRYMVPRSRTTSGSYLADKKYEHSKNYDSRLRQDPDNFC